VRSPFSASVSGLVSQNETGVWYRALQAHFLPTALATSHTTTIPSRFSDASPASPGFEILYLAENHLVALLEVQALLGSPTTPGGVVPHPRSTWAVLNVNVKLQHVVDLSDLAAQTTLDITAQELTGDWLGYRLRNSGTTVAGPTGTAPTQDLGAVLQGIPDLEGFKSLSSRAPYHQILAIFPQKLQSGSEVSWLNPQAGKQESLPV
jgi:RES domain-containing protein